MSEKICDNCVHFGMWSICELNGEYTGKEYTLPFPKKRYDWVSKERHV